MIWPVTILVTGGRDFRDALAVDFAMSYLVRRYLAAIPSPDVEHVWLELISGGCPIGADRLAENWWGEDLMDLLRDVAPENVQIADAKRVFPASWKRYGKSAGPRRNAAMCIEAMRDYRRRQADPFLADPRLVMIAFPGGRGTDNCREQFKKHCEDMPVFSWNDERRILALDGREIQRVDSEKAK